MKYFFVSLWLLLALGVQAFQEKPAKPGKSALESDPKGWIDLFPGPNLTGWKRVPLDEKLNPRNPWSIEGKILLCDGVGIKEMFLHDKVRQDGIFHVEWRFRKVKDPKAPYNSGIYVRAAGDGKHWVQAQVAHLEKPPLLADLFGDVPVKDQVERVLIPGTGHKHAHPPGEWNTFEITCQGPKISVWVNGHVATTWSDCPLRQGHVGLQAEFFFLEFKNLKFKEIKN